MRMKTQSPWGRYLLERAGKGRSVVVFKPIAKDESECRSMAMDDALAQEKAESWSAEDWADYGAGKSKPRKRREFVDA